MSGTPDDGTDRLLRSLSDQEDEEDAEEEKNTRLRTLGNHCPVTMKRRTT